MSRTRPFPSALALIALLGAGPALAQRSTLTISTATVNFPATGGADFWAGGVIVPVTYTVQGNNWPANTTRSELIQLRCRNACPANITFQYRLNGAGGWTNLTATNVTAETQVLTSTAANRNPTFTSTLEWRAVLGWTTEAPGDAANFQVRIRLRQQP